MKIQVLLFGIVTDLLGTSSFVAEVSNRISVKDFKEQLKQQYTNLKHLDSYAIAVNETYATQETVLQENDIVAIIPPVSGG
jgi:molybdopterin converting factor subunit 1